MSAIRNWSELRGTDNTQIGKYAAYKLGSAIGKMGNVAIFSAQEKTQSSQERVKGFLDNIANLMIE